jgi:hypothetical protein
MPGHTAKLPSMATPACANREIPKLVAIDQLGAIWSLPAAMSQCDLLRYTDQERLIRVIPRPVLASSDIFPKSLSGHYPWCLSNRIISLPAPFEGENLCLEVTGRMTHRTLPPGG